MIDRTIFYNHIRENLFNGHMTASQVEGIEAILDEWEKRELTDLRHLAYMFATVYHETGVVHDHVLIRTMQPVKEFGGEHYLKSKEYYPYFGRGFVQLTWNYNYRRMGQLLGVDLYNHPDEALRLPIATQIMFEGMIKGLFTGKKLKDYFNDEREDYYNARRIINGLDRADLVAGYAKEFYQGLIEI